MRLKELKDLERQFYRLGCEDTEELKQLQSEIKKEESHPDTISSEQITRLKKQLKEYRGKLIEFWQKQKNVDGSFINQIKEINKKKIKRVVQIQNLDPKYNKMRKDRNLLKEQIKKLRLK